MYFQVYLHIYLHIFFPICFNTNFAIQFMLSFYRRTVTYLLKLFYYALVLSLKLLLRCTKLCYSDMHFPFIIRFFKPDVWLGNLYSLVNIFYPIKLSELLYFDLLRRLSLNFIRKLYCVYLVKIRNCLNQVLGTNN